MSVLLGLFLFGLACFGFGWLLGLDLGTRDTERRWSEAVKRADARREEESERASGRGTK